MRVLLISSALALLAAPAFADNVTGAILAYDRVAHIIVLDDKTIWEIPADFELPADLMAGESISIEYRSNDDNGVGKYMSITRVDG
ncbi:MAG: hypothetical protein P8J02_01900 [Yoonia sp.]|nr:hypothetical protein [Yoonia sp.]